MLEIVHLSAVHARDDARIFDKQCRTLVARGHRVTLVVADGLGDASRDGVAIVDAGARADGLNGLVAAARRIYLRALALRPDIVQLHHAALLPLGPPLRRHGCKVVFDAGHDLPVPHPVPLRRARDARSAPVAGEAWSRCALAALWSRLERRACRRLDGVIAATPLVRDKFLAVNSATIDVSDFPVPDDVGAGPAWADKPVRVCHEGALSAIRGIVELVRACELLQSPVRLSLAGDFSEAALATRMLARPGWRRIDALGQLGRPGIGHLRASSRAGLITPHATPGHLGAPPATMFEYMAAGIPVIASDFPLWRAVVEAHACGLCVDPRDPPAIAAAIDYLASHPDIARRMGENGRKAVCARYNWPREAAKLIDFYEHL
ncbi:glycosyltransferase [Oxalobacteraceae bacterium OTU3REALA1]|nr:glycosyltransferase [Oxalobacteraceae bacterium OTU3REALA1]